MKTSVWDTPGLTARMVELHASGASYGDMVVKLNTEFGTQITRHACIGRAHRMELPDRPQPIQERWPKPKPKPAPTPRSKPTLVTCEPKGLIELDRDECHYPLAQLDERPPYLFCAMPTIKGAWCKQHYRLVYHAAPLR